MNGPDPFCLFDRFLDELAAPGFSDVQNFPTFGLTDGSFQPNLEDRAMGYSLEVNLIRRVCAHDLLTSPYETCARIGVDSGQFC